MGKTGTVQSAHITLRSQRREHQPVPEPCHPLCWGSSLKGQVWSPPASHESPRLLPKAGCRGGVEEMALGSQALRV